MSDIERAICVILDLREEVLKLREFTREENDKSSEALALLRELARYRAIGTPDECRAAIRELRECEVEIRCLEDEANAYREIGMIDECKEAVEKQRAKKPTISGDCYKCSVCGYTELDILSDFGTEIERFKYCPDCGQRISWEDEA